jgi:hypothetical protein
VFFLEGVNGARRDGTWNAHADISGLPPGRIKALFQFFARAKMQHTDMIQHEQARFLSGNRALAGRVAYQLKLEGDSHAPLLF